MKDAAWITWALGDYSRLRILWLLLAHPGGVCVCEIVDALRMPQHWVSRHLGVLRKVGLVTRNKKGLWHYFEIRSNRLPLARVLIVALALASQSETTWEDRKRFDKRLRLRSDGLCVVGYEPDQPFRDEIPVVQLQPLKERPRWRRREAGPSPRLIMMLFTASDREAKPEEGAQCRLAELEAEEERLRKAA